jgi:hypothetical protein
MMSDSLEAICRRLRLAEKSLRQLTSEDYRLRQVELKLRHLERYYLDAASLHEPCECGSESFINEMREEHRTCSECGKHWVTEL